MVRLSCLADLRSSEVCSAEIRSSDRPPPPRSPRTMNYRFHCSDGLAPPQIPASVRHHDTPRVHPLLHSSWGGAQSEQNSVGVLCQTLRIRHAADLPHPRANQPTQNQPHNRVPPLQNPLWRAPRGGGTVSGRSSGIVQLDSALQPISDICTVPEQSKDRQPRPTGI